MTIYQHKQFPERLIEVDPPENGRIKFYPQGGGFVYSMTVEEFERDWELAKPPEMMRALVGADFMQLEEEFPRYPCFFNGLAWNGWGMPWFEREVVQKIMDLINRHADNGPQLVWVGDGIRDRLDEDDFIYAPQTIQVHGKPVQVWGLGAGCWTWDWPKKLVRVNLQTHVGGEMLEATMKRLDIRVVDDILAPWDVIYEGTEEDLRRMYDEHWGEDCCPFELAKEPT